MSAKMLVKTVLLFSAILCFWPVEGVAKPMGRKSRETVVELSVKEASGIAALPDGSFLVVDDDAGLYQVLPDGTADLLLAAESKNNFGGLEGIALSTDRKFVYCLSERKGLVIRIPLKMEGKQIALGDIQKLGRLPEVGDVPNKGWEGICIVPNGSRDQLVAIHQASPKSVGLFDLPSLKPIAIKGLPSELKKLLDNLSDVTFDARTGNLFLLSGKSQCLVEIPFSPDESLSTFTIISRRDVPLSADERPEGVCFDLHDHLVVVTDGSGSPGKLLRLGD
jgi:uncharacterized protein YjiK